MKLPKWTKKDLIISGILGVFLIGLITTFLSLLFSGKLTVFMASQTASISGTVYSGDPYNPPEGESEPPSVPNARVKIINLPDRSDSETPPPDWSQEVRADNQGKFQITGINISLYGSWYEFKVIVNNQTYDTGFDANFSSNRLNYSNVKLYIDVRGEIQTGAIQGRITETGTNRLLAGVSINLSMGVYSFHINSTENTTTNYNYQKSGLPVGTYTLNISHPGYKTYFDGNVVIQYQRTTEKNIQLQRGTSSQPFNLSGLITNKFTNQLIDANIELTPSDPRNPNRQFDKIVRQAQSSPIDFYNPNPQRRINYLIQGLDRNLNYGIRVYKDGYRDETGRLEGSSVADGQVEATRNFLLVFSGTQSGKGRLTGKVILEGQTDHSGATVEISKVSTVFTPPISTTTDREGNFKFENLAVDQVTSSVQYDVAASKEGYEKSQPKRVTIWANQETYVEFSLKKLTPTIIKGKVTSKSDQQPIINATITLLNDYQRVISTQSDSNGNYQLEYTGECGLFWTVEASHSNYIAEKSSIDQCFGLNIIDFELEYFQRVHQGGITGRVYTDENNVKKYLSGVKVDIHKATYTQSEMTLTTDRVGSFRINLPPNLYEIKFSLTTYATFWKNARVENEMVDLGEIRLGKLNPDTGRIYGWVENISNLQGLEGVEVTAIHIVSGKELKSTTNSGGFFDFNNLIEGSYKIKARKDPFEAVTAVSLNRGEERQITLFLCDNSEFITQNIGGFNFYFYTSAVASVALENKEFLEIASGIIKYLIRKTNFRGEVEFYIVPDSTSEYWGYYIGNGISCNSNNRRDLYSILLELRVIKRESYTTFSHEFGHVIDAYKNIYSDPNWQNAYLAAKSQRTCIVNFISKQGGGQGDYAMKNQYELFAEFFNRYYLYPGSVGLLSTYIENQEGACRNVLRFLFQYFAEKVGKVNPDDAQKYPSIGNGTFSPDQIRQGAWMNRGTLSRALSWASNAATNTYSATVNWFNRNDPGIITGKLTDKNQQILKNATILLSKPEFKKENRQWVIESQNYQTKTDDQGNFRLESTPEGFYFVTIITEDGQWLTPGHSFRTISVIGRGQTQEFDINLE